MGRDLGALVRAAQRHSDSNLRVSIGAHPGADDQAAHAVAYEGHTPLPGLCAQLRDGLFHLRRVVVYGAKQGLQVDRQHSMAQDLQAGCNITPHTMVAAIAMDQQDWQLPALGTSL